MGHMIDGIRPPRRPDSARRSPDRDYLNKFAGRTRSSLPGAQPFRTPHAAAAADKAGQPPQHPSSMPASAAPTDPNGNDTPPFPPLPTRPKQKTSLMDKLRNLDRKQWAIIIAALVLLIGGGIIAFFMLKKDPPVQPAQKPTKQVALPPKPTTEASKLSGLQVDPAVNKRPVTGIMIENSVDSRPQSGLEEADVVFEAVAEGGITRFLALYMDKTTPYIGPVRSVRPYYVQWAMGFDAAIAHAGGSGEALSNIRSWKTKDLDQFAHSAPFTRISSRYAPHNLYTSIEKLNALESQKGYGTANFTGFARKPEQPAKTPDAKSIDINVSSFYFNSHYDYDPATNSYKRSQAGEAHNQVDQNGKVTQLQPKVVVVLVMSQGKASDVHTAYGTIGTGKAHVFQDGKALEGTWKKSSNSDQFVFTNLSNEPLTLNPGQTWLTVVGDSSRVSYKP